MNNLFIIKKKTCQIHTKHFIYYSEIYSEFRDIDKKYCPLISGHPVEKSKILYKFYQFGSS